MKITFITTVYNEEHSIHEFLHSLFLQSKLPDEIIIVDGGSTDKTVPILEKEITDFKRFNKKVSIQLLQKKGNRSVGRNSAIKRSTAEIIACSDAGCILQKDWLKTITEPFQDPKIDVVAGYYSSHPKTIFEKSLVPYVLVMPDRVDPQNFLPATRSVAFTKSIWKKAGEFPEQFSHNEDYVFAKQLKKIGAKIQFKQDAIVFWIPRSSVRTAFYMFYRFARGDAQAHIVRPKSIIIFLRYLFILVLVDFYVTSRNHVILESIGALFVLYCIWSIWKNYRYVNHWKAFFYLPLLQFTSDCAVIVGSFVGFFQK